MKIAVIVPTIRPESWERFYDQWRPLFRKHDVDLFKVDDSGSSPVCFREIILAESGRILFAECGQLAPDFERQPSKEWLFNKTDGCRNLGFYWAEQLTKPDVFITLDDDVYPIGDPIQDHIDALSMSVSPNWMSTAQDWRVRGIPVFGEKWPVMLSHGVWAGVPDFDAPTQLLHPNVQDVAFNKTNVPHGVLFPLCIMNCAFRRELLPWMYQAPMSKRLAEYNVSVGDRFGDIWSGVVAKLACDLNQWGVVTGYSTIYHSRASNVFANLRKESVFLEQNETFVQDWQDQETTNEYVLLYRRMLNAWQKDLANE